MSRTYTLNATLNTGQRNSWGNSDWKSYWAYTGNYLFGHASYTPTNYYVTNMMFDSATLTTLRSKTVTSVKLKLTFGAAGTIPSSGTSALPIGYKYNSTASGDSDSLAWARSNADSTETSTTATAGYFRVNSGERVSVAIGDSYEFNMSTTLPKYGYCVGCQSSSYSGTFTLTAAQLIVVTNESLTLTYNANGGTGAPSSETKNGTPNATFTVSSTTPTRTGYNFGGWNTNSSGTGTNYSAGSSITISSNTTLYAKWTAKTYTVTYNTNGGTGSVSSQTKTYGVTLTLRTYSGTKTGYNFLGWAESATATSAAYSAGGSFTKNADTTLYAVWSANSYAVTYYGNATGATNVPAAQTKTHGVNLTLTTSKPSLTGYTFSKWNTAANGSGTNYSPGATYTGNANLSLYAQWTANTYTISYNANGGDGAPSSQTKTYNVTLTLSATTPTRDYYTFMGWSESNTASSPTYSAGGAFTKNANTTLYAVWRKNRVTIQYKANGASMADTHGANYAIDSDGYVTRSGSRSFHSFDFDVSEDPFNWNNSSAINLTYSGHGVELHYEWNTAADGSGTYFDQAVEYPASDYSASLSSGDQTVVLYVDWRTLYSVTYNADGGSPTPDTQTKMEGVDLVLSDAVPEKAGYAFDNWLGDDSNSYDPGDTYSGNADLALTAQYTQVTPDQYVWSRYANIPGVGDIFLAHDIYVVDENGVPVLQDTYVKN